MRELTFEKLYLFEYDIYHDFWLDNGVFYYFYYITHIERLEVVR